MVLQIIAYILRNKNVFHSMIILMLVSVVVQHTCGTKFEEIEHPQAADCLDKCN